MSILKMVYCYKNKGLPKTNLIESKVEEALQFSYIPKGGQIILKAKEDKKQRVCSICGKTFTVTNNSFILFSLQSTLVKPTDFVGLYMCAQGVIRALKTDRFEF